MARTCKLDLVLNEEPRCLEKHLTADVKVKGCGAGLARVATEAPSLDKELWSLD